MELTDQQRRGLNIALNEAELFGFEIDPCRRVAAATFNVLTLPEHGPPPSDRRVQMLFSPVGRVVATFSRRASDEAPWVLTKFNVEDLLAIVQELGRISVYGWNFIDIPEEDLRPSDQRLSLDWESGADGHQHSITVSPLWRHRALDLSVWFDDLEVRLPTGAPVTLEDFIAGGKRWWDALHAGDQRVQEFGYVPGSPPGDWNMECPGCGAPIAIDQNTRSAKCAECGAEFRR